jgi:hypothetical protein
MMAVFYIKQYTKKKLIRTMIEIISEKIFI